MNITIGSRWNSADGKIFIVTDLAESNDSTWIFYKDQQRQYSCYLESFLSRFTEIQNGY